MGRTLFVGEIIGPDILIILAIVMLLFGSTKIPKLARSLGQASHEFRKGVGEGATDVAPPAPAPAPPSPGPAPAPTPSPKPNGTTAEAESGPAGPSTGSSTTQT